MILDQSIIRQIHLVDDRLSNDITRLASVSRLKILSVETGHYDSNTQIERLQDALQQLRSVVDRFVQVVGKSHDNNINNYSTNVVDLKVLTDIIGSLPPVTIETLQGLENGNDSDDDSNDINIVLTQAIVSYTLILCYYTVITESLVRLPSVRDTEQYFASVSTSLQNKLLYFLQTSATRLLSLVKYAFGKLKSSTPQGSEFIPFAKVSVYRDLPRLEQLLRDIPVKLRQLYETDIQPRINRLIMLQKFQFVGLPRWKKNTNFLIFGVPRLLMDNEVQTKYNYVSERSKFFVRQFGELLSTFPIEGDNSITAGFRSLQQFFIGLDQLDTTRPVTLYDIVLQTRLLVEGVNPIQQVALEKPGFLVRYWPLGLLLVSRGPGLLSQLWSSRYIILEFFDKNVWQFLRGLVFNWVWTPLKDIWATVRHDEGSQIAMMSSGMLDTEMESLCRMMTRFLNENAGPNGTITQMEVLSHIKHGDLDEFMKIYEGEIHNPIKNILTGRLITSLLIQVQKTKVDGSLALNGIDQMLKSQQLVFAFVALSPATLLLYLLVSSLLRFVKMGTIWSSVSAYKLKLACSLNNVERILNYGDLEAEQLDLKYLNQGLLIMESSNLSTYGNVVIPKNRREEWNRDIEELVNVHFSNSAKLNVINRVYHVYGKYF